MYSLKLIILLYSILLTITVNSLDLSNILNNYFNEIYQENNCLYLILNDSTIDNTVSRSLIGVNLPIITSNFELFYNLINNSRCDGYIFTTTNINKTTNWLLQDVKNGRQIKPYEIITILYDADQNFDKWSLLTITEIYAIDVLLIAIDNDLYQLRISSIYDNKTVTITDVNLEDLSLIYRRPKWEPFKTNSSRQTLFIITAFQCTPYFYVDDNNNIVGGVEFSIINEIMKKWPHQYQVLTKNKTILRSDDHWTTARLLIDNKTTDLAPCSQWHNVMSKLNVDTTYPLDQVCLTFLVPKPTLLPNSTFILQAFSIELWFIILGFLIWIYVIVDLAVTLHRKNRFKRMYRDRVAVFFAILRLIFSGSIRFTPAANKHTVRILFAILCYFSVILSTYYNAGITSSLTNPKFTNRITTVEDMAEEEILWLHEDYLIDYFQNSPVKTFNVLSKLSTKDRQKAQSIVTKRLRNNFITDIDGLYEDEKRKLTILRECFDTYYVAFGLKKYSPFTRIFNYYNLKFYENGLMLFWLSNATLKEENFEKDQALLYKNYLEENTIDWRRFRSALYMLVIGDVLAMVAFIYEYCARRK